MDIAKYIGLFLVKNDYCFLPGIGNWEIKRKPAQINSQSENIESPTHILTFSQGLGAIDDQFANFIATNERVSIARVANAIREFSADSKKALSEGEDVLIPGVGTLSGRNNVYNFVQDPSFRAEGRTIPLFKNAVREEAVKEKSIAEIYEETYLKEPKSSDEIELQKPQVNWGKILLLAFLGVLILGGIGYFIWQSTQFSTNTTIEDNTNVNTPDALIEDSLTPPSIAPEDTSTSAPAPNTSTTTSSTITTGAKIIINDYTAQEKAEKRLKQLQSYGHQVELVQKDSTFYIVFPVAAGVVDQQQYTDSLKRLFGGNVRLMN